MGTCGIHEQKPCEACGHDGSGAYVQHGPVWVCVRCAREIREFNDSTETRRADAAEAEVARLKAQDADLRAKLNDNDIPQEIHVEGGMAFSSNFARVQFVLDAMGRFKRERDEAREQIKRHENDCACLPEDQSVTETVTALRAEVARMREEIKEWRSRGFCDRCETNHRLATMAEDENARLRAVVEAQKECVTVLRTLRNAHGQLIPKHWKKEWFDRADAALNALAGLEESDGD